MATARRNQPSGAESLLLSWRRTALEVGIVSVVAARYLGNHASPWFALLGFGGVALALALHATASRAYRDVDTPRTRASGRLAALAVFVAALGGAGLLWVLLAG